MCNVRICVFLFWRLIALPAFADKQDWLPVTPQDLQMKEVPENRGASAIQLYYADHIDDKLHSEFIYRRIRILTDEGKKYADVGIPIYPPGSSISDLKARTIHPDGKIIEFSGKPFQKDHYERPGGQVSGQNLHLAGSYCGQHHRI